MPHSTTAAQAPDGKSSRTGAAPTRFARRATRSTSPAASCGSLRATCPVSNSTSGWRIEWRGSPFRRPHRTFCASHTAITLTISLWIPRPRYRSSRPAFPSRIRTVQFGETCTTKRGPPSQVFTFRHGASTISRDSSWARSPDRLFESTSGFRQSNSGVNLPTSCPTSLGPRVASGFLASVSTHARRRSATSSDRTVSVHTPARPSRDAHRRADPG